MPLLPLLALAALLGVLVGLGAYVVLAAKQQQQAGRPQAGAESDDGGGGVPRGVRRATDRQRQRQLRQRHAAQQQQQEQREAAGGAASSDDEEEDERVPLNRRDARRAERADAREAEAAAREARASKINAYEEKRKRKEAEREAREQAQEEEMVRAAAERQKAEDEEAAKWMSQISVEAAGTVEEAAAGEDQGLLGRFIEYIQARKMVPIEEAATEFGLRSSEVVDRIQGLEAMGRLTGVMDERGKFIYISAAEMEGVAQHIRAAGRISIAALAQRSAELIDLEARSTAVVSGLGPGPAIDFDSLAGEPALEAAA